MGKAIGVTLIIFSVLLLIASIGEILFISQQSNSIYALTANLESANKTAIDASIKLFLLQTTITNAFIAVIAVLLLLQGVSDASKPQY